MENTLENKAKFFAQYWGQYCLQTPRLIYEGNPPEPSHEIWVDDILNEDNIQKILTLGFPLWLKSLSQISDEQAIKLSEMRYSFPEYTTIANGRCMVSCYENQKSLMQTQIDFLRDNSFAVPFHDLTVDEQIEYGWVKLAKSTEL